MTWEQSMRPQISEPFLAVPGASCVASCFSLGKPFRPSAPWFPTPKRKGMRFYSISAALQIALRRSHGGGGTRLRSPCGLRVLSAPRKGLSFQAV